MKILYGGSGRCKVVGGPALAVRGYNTHHERADEIAPDIGEVAVRVADGDPTNFSQWVVGTHDEVTAYLQARIAEVAHMVGTSEDEHGYYSSRHERATALLESVQAIDLTPSPATKLAHALASVMYRHVDGDTVRLALSRARLELVEK